jgi:hypothetical protein
VEAAVKALSSLCQAGLFAEGARIVLEHAAKRPPSLEASLLRVFDERRWGDTAVTLLQQAEPAAAPGVLAP